MSVKLRVNGQTVRIAADGATPLLDVLRNELGLKGSRYGCGLEQCGACMVMIDGEASYSCAREIGSVAGGSFGSLAAGSVAAGSVVAGSVVVGSVVTGSDVVG